MHSSPVEHLRFGIEHMKATVALLREKDLPEDVLDQQRVALHEKVDKQRKQLANWSKHLKDDTQRSLLGLMNKVDKMIGRHVVYMRDAQVTLKVADNVLVVPTSRWTESA